MKKLLGIVVLGLLLSSNAYGEVLTWNCGKSKDLKWINWQLDLEKKQLTSQWQDQRGEDDQVARVISEGDGFVIVKDPANYEWEFNYKSGAVYTAYENDKYYYGDCTSKQSTNTASSSSSSTDDKIAQAKQICKDLGFKTKTEKFADCSLKMLSMQFEVQNRESSSDGGTQQKIVVNQGYSVGDAMIALSGIISDANNVRSSYGGGNCRIFQHAYHASIKCN